MHEDENALWEKVQQQLKAQISENSYEVWMKPLQAIEYKDDTLVLMANDFVKAGVEKKYIRMIEESLLQITGKAIRITIFPVNGCGR